VGEFFEHAWVNYLTRDSWQQVFKVVEHEQRFALPKQR
jgi:hypothetical protein